MFQRIQHLFVRLRLSHDANVVLDGKNFGHTGTKDRLVVSNDHIDHTVSP
jgi:hypothetical protein